jgi:hypothetical protein
MAARCSPIRQRRVPWLRRRWSCIIPYAVRPERHQAGADTACPGSLAREGGQCSRLHFESGSDRDQEHSGVGNAVGSIAATPKLHTKSIGKGGDNFRLRLDPRSARSPHDSIARLPTSQLTKVDSIAFSIIPRILSLSVIACSPRPSRLIWAFKKPSVPAPTCPEMRPRTSWGQWRHRMPMYARD